MTESAANIVNAISWFIVSLTKTTFGPGASDADSRPVSRGKELSKLRLGVAARGSPARQAIEIPSGGKSILNDWTSQKPMFGLLKTGRWGFRRLGLN